MLAATLAPPNRSKGLGSWVGIGAAAGVDGSVCLPCCVAKKLPNLDPPFGLGGADSLGSSCGFSMSALGVEANLAKNWSCPISTAGADLTLAASISKALSRTDVLMLVGATTGSGPPSPFFWAFMDSMNF